MGNKILKDRSEIDSQYKWNLEAMYSSDELWEEDLTEVMIMADDFASYSGRLTKDAKTLLSALKDSDALTQKVERLFSYAHMRKDQDTAVGKYQEMFGRIMSAFSNVMANMSFFTPELLSADEDEILGYLDSEEGLKVYEFAVKKILRQKEHVLTALEENVLAKLTEIFSAPGTIYSMLGDADMKFDTIENSSGEEVELTHSNYITFMEGYDRNVRKAAFESMFGAYKAHINTITASYNAHVKASCTEAKMRNYKSSRQAELYANNIDESVYDNLIDAVHEYLPTFYRYVDLRKKCLKVDELKMYDVYVPLVEIPEREIEFSEGVAMMKEALAPLGKEYLETVQSGIDSGWIDIYPNKNKYSGAYSGGAYDSHPYILLNYTDRLQDVLTLVHEMGHSMHSHYTNTTQPRVYSDYSIFIAEVASTVNECLLLNHLLKHETDDNMKKYLINRFIDEFKGTVFRQTMFAEFERNAHRYVEEGGSLTPDWLSEEYARLNALYFGKTMGADDYIKYEWSRIPHFYSQFYVYQYATGFSAAIAISNRILEEGQSAVEDYKKFLSVGSNVFPVDALKIAGVDMSQKQPVLDAMEFFKELVEQLEDLMK